jgi:hypothetical protein
MLKSPRATRTLLVEGLHTGPEGDPTRNNQPYGSPSATVGHEDGGEGEEQWVGTWAMC